MKLVYFAWVRERVGVPEEEVAPPAHVATVADLIAWLKTRGEEFEYAFESGHLIRAAIDKRHAKHDASLAGAREIAFFPADDGRMMFAIRVQAEDFDVGAEQARLVAGRTDIGAVVAFTGLCRDEGAALAALELEHYPGMAEEEMSRVLDEARARWPLDGAALIHRHGRIRPGENIVLVIAASRHRRAAFAAAEFLMDYLKTRAPFWKKEHRVDGTTGGWVEAKDDDDRALERWSAQHRDQA